MLQWGCSGLTALHGLAYRMRSVMSCASTATPASNPAANCEGNFHADTQQLLRLPPAAVAAAAVSCRL